MRLWLACVLFLGQSCSTDSITGDSGWPKGSKPKAELKKPAKENIDHRPLPQLASLYACWFKGAYPYMFARGPMTTVSGKSFGVYGAGNKGLLFYGGLNDCFGKVLAPEEDSNGSFYALSNIATFSKTTIRQPAGYDFKTINPEIIQWGVTHLVIDPAVRIGGVPAATIYNNVFARYFRLMGESYLSLRSSARRQALRRGYLDAAAMRFPQHSGSGLRYLEDTFAGWLSDYQETWPNVASPMTPAMALGFWLRRMTDKTDLELWKGLRKVYRMYDSDWYLRLKKRYPNAAVTW